MDISILGSGFIARFYATSLQGQRRKDEIVMVFSSKSENAEKFAHDFNIASYSNSMEEAIFHPDVDVVIIALPNFLHLKAVELCVEAKKAVLCTKPLGRTAKEAKHMLDLIENAGIFGGYLEDLCYTPKFMKSMEIIQRGEIGKVLWAKSREAHPGPHSDWFWDIQKSGGGAIIDLACHCVEISRNFIGKDVKPIKVMCWSATQVHPIDAEDNAIGMVKYANGAIGQFEVSWTFRGGMDLRDEVMGTEGSIWLNNFLRTGFEVFTSGKGGSYVAEKAEISKGWLFPVGDEVHELGYTNMFTDMFTAFEEGVEASETFYDGYVTNAILDAALKSSESKQWEPVILDDWRGSETVDDINKIKYYDEDYYLLKEEVLPNGDRKVILKHKKTDKIKQIINPD